MTALPEQLGCQSAFYDLPGLGHMHVVVAGPEAGPPVVLLHGFPDFWYGWRNQIPALAQAGYRVLALDQRGYNITAKTRPYDVLTVAGDVLHLIDAAGYERVRLVGHDWGGAVAWMFAALHPERLERLAVLNLPHLLAAVRTFSRGNLRQWLRSWYMGFFQIPRLPEAMLRRKDFSATKAALRASARPGTFSDEDLDRYARAWSQPGAFEAMLGWYRAVWVTRRQVLAHTERLERITVSALVLWGERDTALIPEFAAASGQYLQAGRVITLPEATHWLHMEFPEVVNQHLLEHLRGGHV